MEPSPGRCKDHQFQEKIRSLVFLWVCKRASQSTVFFFSVSGIVELYPSITSRKTGGIEALLFLVNTASRRILWWTWISCFFLLKALHKNGAAFQHLSTVFPGLSAANLKEGNFVGPQIREVLKDTDFEERLNLKELRAWEAFKSVCSGFLGNTRLPDYQACIEKLLKSYENMGYWMSLKIRFLHSPSISSRQTLEKWVMSMENDSTKTLRRWRATIKANGTPAWWDTSAGCSCVTSRRQNTPDLLRKHTFHCLWYYELCNCVIQVYWFNQCSLSILFYLL